MAVLLDLLPPSGFHVQTADPHSNNTYRDLVTVRQLAKPAGSACFSSLAAVPNPDDLLMPTPISRTLGSVGIDFRTVAVAISLKVCLAEEEPSTRNTCNHPRMRGSSCLRGMPAVSFQQSSEYIACH